MTTSIIILTHNVLPMTQQCLESIRRYTDNYELIIVDNGSTDGTVEYLQAQSDVKLIRNERNLGFAKGCNQGLEIASGDAVLFLNNDTIVTPHWLSRMRKVLNSDERIGIVGPVSNFVGGQQRIRVNYTTIPEMEAFAETIARRNANVRIEVRWLSGFCMLVRRKVFQDIGPFDERFGLGSYEDDDLCLRALSHGYRLFIAADSFVHHAGHKTMYALGRGVLQGQMDANRAKAKEKWGEDIKVLRNKQLPTLTLVLPLDGTEVGKLKETAACLRDVAAETVVVYAEAEPEMLAEAAAFAAQAIHTGGEAPERWWAKVAEAASGDYLLWMNPGERLTAEGQRKLAALQWALTEQTDAAALRLQPEGGASTFVVRIVRRKAAFRWDPLACEFLVDAADRVKQSDIVLS